MGGTAGRLSGALNVVMLGPPGAGKGTQAERLSRTRKLPKISTGDILREAAQAGTEVGRAAKATMEAGNLVGDDIMIAIVQDRLEPRRRALRVRARRVSADGRAGDGARSDGRRTAGRWWCSTWSCRRTCSCGGWRRGGSAASAASNAAPDWTTACGKCGGALVTRVDDGIDIVRERLKVYLRQTKPLVEYYAARPTFTRDRRQPAARRRDGARSTRRSIAALEAAARGAAL